MSTATLFVLIGCLFLASVIAMLLAVWVAVRRRGWRTAGRITLEFNLWWLVILAVMYGGLWLARDASGELGRVVAAAVGIASLIGPFVLMQHLLAKRTELAGKRAWAWSVGIVLASGAVSIAVAMAFRAQFVEAFVVPTGAMAPTVLGQHHDAACAACGLAYPIGPLDELATRDGYLTPIPNREPAALTCPNCGAEHILPPGTPIRDGDRILADKTSQPKRWDLVVFDSPEDRRVRYIKRLVGLPGERIEIRGGEIYADDAIVPKPVTGIDGLWFPVHDTAIDGASRIGAGGERAWVADDAHPGWSARDGRWRGEATGDETATLRFEPPITNALGYNQAHSARDGGDPVGDVRVELDIESFEGAGTLHIEWRYRGRAFTAAIDGPGRGAERQISHQFGPVNRGAGAAQPFPADRTVRTFAMAVRDGRVGVTTDDAAMPPAILPDGPEGEVTPAYPEFRIVLSNASATIRRVRVWRDVHYTATGRNLRMQLAADEWCMLGDNSAWSRDSRFYGPVPMDHFVGVVRWCYWPTKRWRAFDRWPVPDPSPPDGTPQPIAPAAP